MVQLITIGKKIHELIIFAYQDDDIGTYLKTSEIIEFKNGKLTLGIKTKSMPLIDNIQRRIDQDFNEAGVRVQVHIKPFRKSYRGLV